MAKTLEIFENIQRLRKRYYQVYQGKQALLDLISETEVGEQVYTSIMAARTMSLSFDSMVLSLNIWVVS
jgi:hypothetical protein